jgi:hypothetical protein
LTVELIEAHEKKKAVDGWVQFVIAEDSAVWQNGGGGDLRLECVDLCDVQLILRR